jgi:hypothetical protein
MDENTRKKVLEIIKKSIDEVVYDEMRQLPGRLQAKQEELKKTKAQREQDAHEALFGGKQDEMNYRLQLHEAIETPKITPSELDDFEREFKSRFPNIVFEKQNAPGQNGQIVDFPVINEQKDAITSGKITIDKDSIGFTMSLINGFKVRSIIEGGIPKEFEIKSETKDIFGKILNLYEELFKKRFNEIINPAAEDTEEMMSTETPTSTETPAVAVPPAPSTPPAPVA